MGLEKVFRQKEEASRKGDKGRTHIAVYNAERSGARIRQHYPISIIATASLIVLKAGMYSNRSSQSTDRPIWIQPSKKTKSRALVNLGHSFPYVSQGRQSKSSLLE
jgi:hypothetical protein